jgi:DNA-binding transcriptional LysR family regulator
MTIRWTLDDLRIFCALAEAGTMTAAAEQVSLSLPTVSARLRSLEDAFGTALCLRTQKGVTLTAAGQRLVGHARDLLEKAARTNEDVSDFARAPRGHVRLAANTTAVSEHLPELMARFLASYPKIDVALVEATSAEVVKQGREGQADIGIYSPNFAVPDLATFPFCDDELVLIVSVRHRWKKQTEIAYDEVLQEDQVCPQRTAALFHFLSDRAREAGRKLRSRIHVAGFDAIARMVAQGVGIAVIPGSAARRLQTLHNVRVLTLTDKWAENQLLLCVRDADELSPATTALLQILQQGVLQSS